MDSQLLRDQLAGIKAKGDAARAKEKKFLEAIGLDKEIEKAKNEMIDLETQLPALKEQCSTATAKKNAAVQKSISAIAEKMAEVLPDGMPTFLINDDGSLTIGWEYDSRFRPYEGLSGGEKVQFDLALAHALNAGILLMEGAEADDKSLLDTMVMLSGVNTQIIICTCHPPAEVPDGWLHIALGGQKVVDKPEAL